MHSPIARLSATGNRLLDSLKDKDREKLFRHLQAVTLIKGETIYHQDEPIQSVYFPSSGLVSVITTAQSGESVEVGMVGYEGLTGIAAILGDGIAHNRCAVVQIESNGMMIKAETLRQEMKESKQLQEVLLRYAQAYLTFVSQSAFCQCFHHIEERLARWLLECQFRVKSDEFHMTHEYIAQLIGVRRAGLTEAMVSLKEKGVITHHRGTVKITDNEKLEALACECCRIIRTEFERLFREREQ